MRYRTGTIELDIPKLRTGTYFPSLLEPRRPHERALVCVVQEACIHGVRTRSVDALAEALGLKAISKDQVSRICKELDAQVHAFRTTRPLDDEYPSRLSGPAPGRLRVRSVDAWARWPQTDEAGDGPRPASTPCPSRGDEAKGDRLSDPLESSCWPCGRRWGTRAIRSRR